MSCSSGPGHVHQRCVERSFLGCQAVGAVLVALALVRPVTAQAKAALELQAVPQPRQQIAFERDGREIARMHFGPDLRRPFVFPLIGPSGRALTRMGHPHDPEGHSHHNSVWLSHHKVNGLDFWGDRGKGRIVHQRVEKIVDAGSASWVITHHAWLDEATNKPLLLERRRTQVQLLDKGEFLLILDSQWQAKEPVTLDKTPFGMIGVRMAKTIGVNDGGGTIRNSDGLVDEKEVFWKRAKWVDYSGPIAGSAQEGITLLDHPSNPNHPSHFHVRNDGWMGACLTFAEPRVLAPGDSLKLRYGLYVHAGVPAVEQLNQRWLDFAKLTLVDAKK